MKFLVVYFSRDGKTRRVAKIISQELECEAIDVEKETPDISGVDLLVVGSGTYGGIPGIKIAEFLNGIQQASGGKAAVFTTSAGPDPKSIPNMKGALEGKGYEVISSFDCRGQLFLVNRGHPDEKDLENARAFGNDLKKRIGG